MSDPYKNAPTPKRRCENCANGARSERYEDVYVCSLDGRNKDYRVTCDEWERKRR